MTDINAVVEHYIKLRDHKSMLDAEHKARVAEIDAQIYRLAAQMEPLVGRAGVLRYLRDGLARALAPLLRDVREAVEGADGYDAADAALRRLEGTRADGLEGVLVGAMMNGTSAGAVDG